MNYCYIGGACGLDYAHHCLDVGLYGEHDMRDHVSFSPRLILIVNLTTIINYKPQLWCISFSSFNEPCLLNKVLRHDFIWFELREKIYNPMVSEHTYKKSKTEANFDGHSILDLTWFETRGCRAIDKPRRDGYVRRD